MKGTTGTLCMVSSLYLTLVLQSSALQLSSRESVSIFLPSLWIAAWLVWWPGIRALLAAALMGLGLDAFSSEHLGLGMVLSVLSTAVAAAFIDRFQPRAAVVWGGIVVALASMQSSCWQIAHLLASGAELNEMLNPAWLRVPLLTGIAATCFILLKRSLYWHWLDWNGELERRSGSWSATR